MGWLRWAAQALWAAARGHGRLTACLALLAVWVCPASPAAATVRGDEPVSLQASWCAVASHWDIDAVVNSSCSWQTLTSGGFTQGIDSRAFWLRLELSNDSDRPLERWLELGHPQMAEISLFFSGARGWERHELGLQLPLSARGSVEKNYGVVPVRLAPGAVQTVWVRMASDTVIIVRARVWSPDDFRVHLQRRQFWSGLGIGALLLTVLFSALMMVLNRQEAYGYFAVGLLGQFVAASMMSGVFQRFFWPQDWGVTSAIRDIGSLLAIFGFSRFLGSFLPQLRRYAVLSVAFRAAAYVSVTILLARLAGLRGLDSAWFFAVAFGCLCGALICAKAWREGDRAAGIMAVAFATLVLFTAVRLLVTMGAVSFVTELTQLPALGVFVISPLVLLALVDRTRQLQDELSRVQAENAAQLRFLANMSHELRSPLDNVLGNAQLLAREARSPSQISGINSIFDSGRQLLRIIDHILDYARGSAGMIKMEPAPLHLANFLRGIERMAKLLAVQRNNRFELKLRGPQSFVRALNVMADAERLRQVLSNLLGNAARHTTDGLITLEIGAVQRSGTRITLDFSVTDTGEGISAQEQARIFKPFERAESSAPYAGKGAGLGLAIARQMVELMGGRLAVRSTPGQGATFRFHVTVPLLKVDATSAAERLEGFDAAGYVGPRRRVLVVDDEEASRIVIASLLEGLGFEVMRARSGAQAVALLPELRSLDLVLTDQYMPDGDGWLVLERVHALFPQVPVVMISAAPPSPPPGWDSQLRFAAQFMRPVDHAQLLARIGDLLDLYWSDQATETVDGDATTLGPSLEHPQAMSDLVRPAAKDLQSLAQLVELGQVTAIEEWGSRVLAERPECAAFVDLVLQAVHRLDFQTLLHLATNAGELATSPSSRQA
jgi:two-component system, sensor histidine kinase LadS